MGTIWIWHHWNRTNLQNEDNMSFIPHGEHKTKETMKQLWGFFSHITPQRISFFDFLVLYMVHLMVHLKIQLVLQKC